MEDLMSTDFIQMDYSPSGIRKVIMDKKLMAVQDKPTVMINPTEDINW